MNSVNLGDMNKKEARLLDDKVALEYSILKETSLFLNSKFLKKQAELFFLNKKLEIEYSDELYNRFQDAIKELKSIERKMNWEKKQCEKFDEKLKDLNVKKHQEFVSSLSKKILSKSKK